MTQVDQYLDGFSNIWLQMFFIAVCRRYHDSFCATFVPASFAVDLGWDCHTPPPSSILALLKRKWDYMHP
jgi:hypothetical protein